MSKPYLRAFPVLLVTTMIVLAGCGGSASPPRTAGHAKPVTVAITMFAFHPATVTVAPGTTVVFTNKDTTEHTATADDGRFDTGAIQHDQSRLVTFTKAGTYAYKCGFHPFMTGTVIVR
jgi:plastocyanin